MNKGRQDTESQDLRKWFSLIPCPTDDNHTTVNVFHLIGRILFPSLKTNLVSAVFVR